MRKKTHAVSSAPAGASSGSHLLLCLLFGASGMGALIYEIVWSRTLQFIFGSTTETISTILAGMLLGFSVGSFAFRGKAEAAASPLFHLAVLEASVGIYGFMMPLLTDLTKALYFAGPDLLAIRIGYCVALVFVPSLFLGALWPYVGRFCLDHQSNRGVRAGTFYATNAFGSAIGASAAGFILIPALGLFKTLWLSALLNLVIAGILYLLHRRCVHEK
jgi:spermidine synthase